MNSTSSNPAATDQLSVGSSSLPIQQEAESTIIDLLLTIAKYKWIVLIATVGSLGVGLVSALLLPVNYAYSAIIELGLVEQDRLIEPPDAVITKITTAYLPPIERKYGEQIGIPTFILGLEVRNPRGTNLIVMSSKGTIEEENEHLTLHHQVAKRVIEDHQRDFLFSRTIMNLELAEAQRIAAGIKDKLAALTVRRTLLQEKKSLATQRIQQMDGELSVIESNRSAAGKSISGQDQVLTLMMLDLQVSREREIRSELQRELSIGLNEESDRIVREEADLQRSQQDHEGRVSAIQARIAHLSETKMIGPPQRSQKQAGLGRGSMISISGFLGLIIGILAACFWQSVIQRRESAKVDHNPV